MSTNRIVIHSKDGNIPMDKNMLCDIVGASKRTIDEFMNECIEKKYISLLEINKEFFGYIVNPLYMMNGNSLNLYLYLIFKDDENFIFNIPKKDIAKMNEYLRIVSKI